MGSRKIHIKVGRALAPLRDEGVLIIGSGLSYHNLRDLMTHKPKAAVASQEFDTWLQDTLLHSSPTERIDKLCHWTDAPSARAAHPAEDHLLPLMVAIGAAENDHANMIYHEDGFMGQVTASSFRFGG